MAFADANRAQIRILEESTWGTTPSSGSSREMRLTSSSLVANKETVVSDELRADRMVSDIVEVAASSGGDINFEWSAGPQDELMAGFLLSAWTRPMTLDYWKGTIVTVSANDTITVVGLDLTGYLVAGRRIKTTGFANAANNGYWAIDSVTLNGSNTDIVLTGVTSLVVETGTVVTRLYDANDVIVLNNTTVAATAAGFSGTGVFTAAAAAGQLLVGQQIAVEGLGYGTATVVFSSAAASTFACTISDGINERTITTTTDFAPGASFTDSATNFAAYINTTARTGANALNVKASVSSGTVTITNLNTFETDNVTRVRTETTGGGYVYESTADANVAVTSFSLYEGSASGVLSTLVLTLFDGEETTTALTAGTDYTVGVSAAADIDALAAAIHALDGWAAVSDGAGAIDIFPKYGEATVTISTVDANFTEDTALAYTGSTSPRGVFQITGVTNDLISVTPSPGTFSAGQEVVIKGSHLRNYGTLASINQRSWSIETAFSDISQFMEQDGMVVGTMALEIASGSILTGTFGFEGRATSLRQTTLLGNTALYTTLDAQPGEVSNATTDVGNVTKDGSTLNACIQSLSISGEAGLRMQNCIGNKFPSGIGTGRFNLTGSATIFFENEELFTDFIDHNTISLGWSVTDAENQAYYFQIPAAKFSQDEIAPGGIDQDVFENFEWTAFRDASTDSMFMIDRFSNDAGV